MNRTGESGKEYFGYNKGSEKRKKRQERYLE